jgi:hypothetical protein
MQLRQHEAGPFLILPIRPVHHDCPHQAQRIDGQMPFAASDLLAGIVAVRLDIPFSCAAGKFMAAGF